MAEPVPAGSDVSAGTYACTNCGNEIDVQSTESLPPCPECSNGEWRTIKRRRLRRRPVPGAAGRLRALSRGCLVDVFTLHEQVDEAAR